MKILIAGAALLLSGCAGLGVASPGMASYTLESNDCRATVASGRNVAEASIEGCGVKVQVKGLTGQEAQLKAIELLDRKLP